MARNQVELMDQFYGPLTAVDVAVHFCKSLCSSANVVLLSCTMDQWRKWLEAPCEHQNCPGSLLVQVRQGREWIMGCFGNGLNQWVIQGWILEAVMPARSYPTFIILIYLSSSSQSSKTDDASLQWPTGNQLAYQEVSGRYFINLPLIVHLISSTTTKHAVPAVSVTLNAMD